MSAAVVVLLVGGIVLGDDPRATDRKSAEDRDEPGENRGTTTRPEATSTTDVLPGAPLLGEPSGLLLMTTDHQGGFGSKVIDLDTGEITRLEARALAVTDDGLIVYDAGTVALWPAPYDGSASTKLATIPRALVVAETWVVDGGPLVWLLLRPPMPGAPSFPVSAELVDVNGRALAHLDIRDDLWPHGAIDRGVVVSGPGGVYVIDPEGVIERLSIGELVAVGHDRVYVFSCDERFRCAIEVLDGQGQSVDRRAVSDRSPPGAGGGSIVSPDGHIASIEYHDMEGGLNKVLVDGVPVFEAAITGNPTWSPDGRWLVVPSGDGIHLIDTRRDTEPVVVEVGTAYNQYQLLVPG